MASVSPEPIREEPEPEPARPDEWLSSLTNGVAPSTWQPPAAPAAPSAWKNDPFGSEWAQIAERNNQANRATNPFIENGPAKVFEVQM